MKNVLHFPPTPIMDRFMMAFIQHVLPEFPIIDRNKLRDMYDAFVKGFVLSPLLFHSILYAAALYVDETVISEGGFSSRAAAKDFFYTRATILYGMDCERQQIVIIQALLLISPWWRDYAEEKDTRYWIGCACKIAQTMGMHTRVAPTCKLSFEERSIWRRIFWTIFARDRNASVGLARPFLINSDDVDVEPLTIEDFFETPVDKSRHTTFNDGSSLSEVDFNASSPVHILFAVELVRFSTLLDRIAKANVGQRLEPTRSLETLTTCYNELVREPPRTLSQFFSGRADIKTRSEVDNMWLTFLHINYERIVALNCRYLHKILSETAITHADTPRLQDIRTSIVRSAARSINLYEDLLVVGTLRYSHGFMNTAIFIALLTYAEEIKLAPKESHRFKSAASKFSMGLIILEEMGKNWSVPVWANSLFQYLSCNDFARLRQLPQRPSRWSSPSLLDPHGGGPPFSERREGPFDNCGDASVESVVDESWLMDCFTLQDINSWFQFDDHEIQQSVMQSHE
ncbi:uncharacterized protein A1O5_06835 [Cladophialophora psammophila CBS 110553]|uniref:Xylanolytic transcriptional activator regulatory domain-containing protein n=1 Tax=Cladophialophora psammophila CBS 110553 TaxID=1182543 RepID=W9XHC3_9EURO|nr:uncharacterized protein A1O5_06835 [Cladophialophora psammophila CBS 110553]EXJ69764.1 hypothetical protein A1O5_06835 [Cladophialophora psammophila CBS 110553]